MSKKSSLQSLGKFGGSVVFIGPGFLNGKEGISFLPFRYGPSNNRLLMPLVQFNDRSLFIPGYDNAPKLAEDERKARIAALVEKGMEPFEASLQVLDVNQKGALGYVWTPISPQFLRVIYPYK